MSCVAFEGCGKRDKDARWLFEFRDSELTMPWIAMVLVSVIENH